MVHALLNIRINYTHSGLAAPERHDLVSTRAFIRWAYCFWSEFAECSARICLLSVVRGAVDAACGRTRCVVAELGGRRHVATPSHHDRAVTSAGADLANDREADGAIRAVSGGKMTTRFRTKLFKSVLGCGCNLGLGEFDEEAQLDDVAQWLEERGYTVTKMNGVAAGERNQQEITEAV